MKNVLIYTSPARGHLYPMMDVAIELRDRGYDVTVQTLSGEKKSVESEHLRHRAISPKIESLELEDYKESNPISQIKSAFSSWLSRAPYELEDLQTSIDKLEPDLLIIDVNTWGAGAFAEAQGKPWVMFMPYCLPVSSEDTPAFGPGFAPPTSLIHRFRDRIVDRMVRRAVRNIITELNEIRSQHQVTQLNSYEEIFSKPDLVLYRTAEPFDYPRRKWPESILPIGPGLWAPPGKKPDWIQNLPTPKILVSISTEMQNDGAIIETSLRALADEPGTVIVTTSALDPKEFSGLHPHAHINRFLPHAQVIPEMDLVITHGGMGTTQRALSSGVPVCVIPWGRDQSETGRRVEVSGAGTMLSKNRLKEKQLKEAVRNALKCRSGAEKVAKAFKKAGGAQKAVDAIADL